MKSFNVFCDSFLVGQIPIHVPFPHMKASQNRFRNEPGKWTAGMLRKRNVIPKITLLRWKMRNQLEDTRTESTMQNIVHTIKI